MTENIFEKLCLREYKYWSYNEKTRDTGRYPGSFCKSAYKGMQNNGKKPIYLNESPKIGKRLNAANKKPDLLTNMHKFKMYLFHTMHNLQ